MRAQTTGPLLLVIGLSLAPMAPLLATKSTLGREPDYCYRGQVTGYNRMDFTTRTYDGTSIRTPEAIAAAGWDIPLDSYVWVQGVGTYRVADRGRLGQGHIDIATWSRAEAYDLTGMYWICVWLPNPD